MLSVAVLLAIAIVVISVLAVSVARILKELRAVELDYHNSAELITRLQRKSEKLSSELAEAVQFYGKINGELQTAYNEKVAELADCQEVADVYFSDFARCCEKLNRVRSLLNESVEDDKRTVAKNS